MYMEELLIHTMFLASDMVINYLMISVILAIYKMLIVSIAIQVSAPRI